VTLRQSDGVDVVRREFGHDVASSLQE